MRKLRFSVAEADAGSRLDRALAGRHEIGSRALAERLLSRGAVLVDGQARTKSHRLDAGAVVEVALPDETVDELVALYRAVFGEHTDWDEYRRDMVADGRLVVRLHFDHAYGMVPTG